MTPARVLSHPSRVLRIVESETQREHRMTREALHRDVWGKPQPGYLPEEPIGITQRPPLDWEGAYNGLVGVVRKCCEEIRELRGRIDRYEGKEGDSVR